MKTNQPTWKCIAQLGDANPVDYGGYWVFTDKTGVYPPEAELLTEGDRNLMFAYRFILEKCTYINGVLSDNKSHTDHKAWFADDVASLASFVGSSPEELIAQFCSDDPLLRARAYQAVGDYFGFDNLDSYPLRLRTAEARKRYGAARYAVKD